MQEIQDMKDMVDVTRCWKCKNWKNFTVRKGGEVMPEDMGLCTKYSIVKDAVGYCDMEKEQTNHEETENYDYSIGGYGTGSLRQ